MIRVTVFGTNCKVIIIFPALLYHPKKCFERLIADMIQAQGMVQFLKNAISSLHNTGKTENVFFKNIRKETEKWMV